jgi:hypothetical protein
MAGAGARRTALHATCQAAPSARIAEAESQASFTEEEGARPPTRGVRARACHHGVSACFASRGGRGCLALVRACAREGAARAAVFPAAVELVSAPGARLARRYAQSSASAGVGGRRRAWSGAVMKIATKLATAAATALRANASE